MFNYLDSHKQLIKERAKNEALNARQYSAEVATSIAFVTLAENGTIDDVTATEHADMFAPWAVGVKYGVNSVCRHDGILYRCVQEHTSQADWTPDAAQSLWAKMGDPAEEFPAWSQPVGAHDAYKHGDKVSHGGKHWISTYDSDNVWEPGVFGWEVVQ